MTEPQVDDNTLYSRYASGDIKAFEVLYKRHKGPTYRYFRRQLKAPHEAEDLFQKLWEKVIKQAVSYQPKAKFNTWLYTLARNLIIDNTRHLQVVDNILADEIESDQQVDIKLTPDNQYQTARCAEALKYCITRLPQVQVESFLLKEEGALTAQEIANVVGASLEATKSRLRSALQNLRQCIALKLGREVA